MSIAKSLTENLESDAEVLKTALQGIKTKSVRRIVQNMAICAQSTANMRKNKEEPLLEKEILIYLKQCLI